jgi:hypothetical protein
VAVVVVRGSSRSRGGGSSSSTSSTFRLFCTNGPSPYLIESVVSFLHMRKDLSFL